MVYQQAPRSSPTTATAIASATVTIQNIPNAIPPFASRGVTSNHFPNQYNMNNSQSDYHRSDNRSKHYQMSQIYSADMYNPEHPIINDTHAYQRTQNHSANLGHVKINNRRQAYAGYSNQQQYYYNNQGAVEKYTMGQNNYNQGYGEHSGYNHYGYGYSNDGSEVNHMHNSVQVNHEHTGNYYPSDAVIPVNKHQTPAEYPSKVGYYENNYPSNHLPQGAATGMFQVLLNVSNIFKYYFY